MWYDFTTNTSLDSLWSPSLGLTEKRILLAYSRRQIPPGFQTELWFWNQPTLAAQNRDSILLGEIHEDTMEELCLLHVA